MSNSTIIKDLSLLGKTMEFEPVYSEVFRKEVYMVDLNDIAVGTIHVLNKKRPAVIIQNDIGNKYSGTVIVALITSTQKKEYPMHYKFNLNGTDSTIAFEQILTLDKSRLIEKIGELTPKQMKDAEDKLMYSLELNKFSLQNVLDIEVVNRTIVKTRTEEFVSFNIEIKFQNNLSQIANVKLDKLKEFKVDINENIEFDKLKSLLDCCKGLNFLFNNI